MLTTKIDSSEVLREQPRYPLIAISEVTGIIVLFSARSKGTVLGYIGTEKDIRDTNPVGMYSTVWSELVDESVCGCFKPIKPGTKIVLQQE